jgi:hypothetical protein
MAIIYHNNYWVFFLLFRLYICRQGKHIFIIQIDSLEVPIICMRIYFRFYLQSKKKEEFQDVYSNRAICLVYLYHTLARISSHYSHLMRERDKTKNVLLLTILHSMQQLSRILEFVTWPTNRGYAIFLIIQTKAGTSWWHFSPQLCEKVSQGFVLVSLV